MLVLVLQTWCEIHQWTPDFPGDLRTGLPYPARHSPQNLQRQLGNEETTDLGQLRRAVRKSQLVSADSLCGGNLGKLWVTATGLSLIAGPREGFAVFFWTSPFPWVWGIGILDMPVPRLTTHVHTTSSTSHTASNSRLVSNLLMFLLISSRFNFGRSYLYFFYIFHYVP